MKLDAEDMRMVATQVFIHNIYLKNPTPRGSFKSGNRGCDTDYASK
jgi:hypothetical protein